MQKKDLVGILGKEEFQEKKEFKIKRSETLQSMLDYFDALSSKKLRVERLFHVEEIYNEITKSHPQKYTSADILDFSKNIHQYQYAHFGSILGIYFSALINNCEEKQVSISTSQLLVLPNYLAYKNKDHEVTIDGDTGGCLGYEMCGGEIIVNGSVGPCVGYYMSGGKIVVMQNASYAVGTGMSGGVIEIYGDSEFIGNMFKGRIIIHGNYPCKNSGDDSW